MASAYSRVFAYAKVRIIAMRLLFDVDEQSRGRDARRHHGFCRQHRAKAWEKGPGRERARVSRDFETPELAYRNFDTFRRLRVSDEEGIATGHRVQNTLP